MKRRALLILLSLISLNAVAQYSDTLWQRFDNHNFIFVGNSSNTKLIIFLHGGVNNPVFANITEKPNLDFLLEGNVEFIKFCDSNKFNLLIPIKDDSLNWLINFNYCFEEFDKYIKNSRHQYQSMYLSGFSDGGTGSYKIFYQHPENYDGLIVFNGYPQHNNFVKKVNYNYIQNKKVIFCSTLNDEVIPYEFLLAEYCHQKTFNACTYLYIKEGKHSFSEYKHDDLRLVFDIINGKNKNMQNEPLHGFITNDTLIHFYPFRKSIVKKFNFGKEIFDINQIQKKLYQK